jgi:hypothetical protein
MPERTEQDRNEAIGPDVDIPGVYPSGQVSGEGDSGKPAPTKETRRADSLGDLTKDVSTSTVAEESGGMGSPLYDEGKRKDS